MGEQGRGRLLQMTTAPVIRTDGTRGRTSHLRIVQRYLSLYRQATGKDRSLWVLAVSPSPSGSMVGLSLHQISSDTYAQEYSDSLLVNPGESVQQVVAEALANWDSDRMGGFPPVDYVMVFVSRTPDVYRVCAALIDYWRTCPEKLPGFDGAAAITLSELEAN